MVFWATSRVMVISKMMFACWAVHMLGWEGGIQHFPASLNQLMWSQRSEDFIGKLAPCTSPKSPNLLDIVPSMLQTCVQALITSLHTLLAIVCQKECEEAVVKVCCAINNGFAVPNMSHSVTGAETAVDRRLNCSATADTRIKCEIWKLPHNLHRNVNMWHQRLLVLSGMRSHSELSLGRIFLLEKNKNTDLCNSFQILNLFWSYSLSLPSIACSPYPSSSWDPRSSAYGQVCTYRLQIVF